MMSWVTTYSGRLYQKWYNLVVQCLLNLLIYVSDVDGIWEDSRRGILSIRQQGISILAAVLLV